jgi:hypothetical protein
MKKKFFLWGMFCIALTFGFMMLSSCDTDKKSCDDENNCSAANNAYYCGKSGCAANTGNRCSCD